MTTKVHSNNELERAFASLNSRNSNRTYDSPPRRPSGRISIHGIDRTLSKTSPLEKYSNKIGGNNQEKKIIPDRSYSYKCDGTLSGESSLNGKRVQWKAIFDKPIEQFIYPSLEAFESLENGCSTPSRSAPEKKQSLLQLLTPPEKRKSSAHTLPIASLAASKQHSAKRIFPHISTPISSLKVDDLVAQEMNQNQLYSPIERAISQKLKNAQANRSLTSTSASTRWQLTISEPSEQQQQLHTARAKTALDEGLSKGETFLRKTIRTNYRDSVADVLGDLGLKSRGVGRSSSTMSMSMSMSLSSTPVTLPPALASSLKSAETYSALVMDSRQNQMRSPPRDKCFTTSMFAPDVAEVEVDDEDGLGAAIQYYRGHTIRQQNKIETDDDYTVVLPISRNSIAKRFSDHNNNNNSNNNGQRLSSINTNNNHNNNPITSDDSIFNSNFIDEDKRREELMSPLYLSRVRRAAHNHNMGFDHKSFIDHGCLDNNDISELQNALRKNSNFDCDSSNDNSIIENNNITNTNNNNKYNNNNNNNHQQQSSDDSIDYRNISDSDMIDIKRRHAQDILLVKELEAGVLPENLLRKVPHMKYVTKVDLSHYGIGDGLGKCLGKSLSSLDMLQCLALRNNRLTSASIPCILENLSTTTVHYLDLSENNLRGEASIALGRYLVIHDSLSCLEIMHGHINCVDATKIFSALSDPLGKGQLHDLKISNNKIRKLGAEALSAYIAKTHCTLAYLDISWNELGIYGANTMSEALSTNKSLKYLDLGTNSLKDQGAQRIAASLVSNRTLSELSLASNGVGEKACFVFSRVLSQNPIKLNLSGNPLGEAGARCIFRTLLRQLDSFVTMKNCTYEINEQSFNHANPSVGSPYTLDMSEPYQAALVEELISMVEDGHGCSFDSVICIDARDGRESHLNLVVKDKKVVIKGSANKKWTPPTTGVLVISLSHRIQLPTIDLVLSDESLHQLLSIVVHAHSEADMKYWLTLLCTDAYFTTSKVQTMIDYLVSSNLIGGGSLTRVDVFECVWANLIDSQNKYDFLCENLDVSDRYALAQSMSFEKFRFNWLNPTGHWRLDLGNRSQRNVMTQILALNSVESEFSEKYSKRGDTSQKGNWYNFRNECFRGGQNEITIDADFALNTPWNGVIEFDYVSTTRPISTSDVKTITPMEFEVMLANLGLSTRKRLSKANNLMNFMGLQMAVVKYYFTTSDVMTVMDCFSPDDTTQVKVIVCMFSRIKNLEDMNIIMRHLSSAAVQDLVQRIGWLNIMNPFKPCNDFILSHKYIDNRILTVKLLDLSAAESGDQLKEQPRTEFLLVQLYASMGRITAEYSNKVLRVAYCDFGERQSPPNWNKRRELISSFLIGTAPICPDVFKTMLMYKELESVGALSVGPIDQQYYEYQKTIKQKKVRRRLKRLNSVSSTTSANPNSNTNTSNDYNSGRDIDNGSSTSVNTNDDDGLYSSFSYDMNEDDNDSVVQSPAVASRSVTNNNSSNRRNSSVTVSTMKRQNSLSSVNSNTLMRRNSTVTRSPVATPTASTPVSAVITAAAVAATDGNEPQLLNKSFAENAKSVL
eukprot:gene200-359_t